jgi:hypothetical protein
MDGSSARSTNIANARILVEYLDAYGASSVTSIARATGVSVHEVQNAIRYALDHGMVGRTRHADALPHERVRYFATGQMAPGKAPEFSFDSLLQAWGLASVPPATSSGIRCRRFVCPDIAGFQAGELAAT